MVAKGSTKPQRLSASEFLSEIIVSIRFEDGSHVEFKYAFVIKALGFREITIFTKYCGYYIFSLCDRLEITVNKF